LILERYESQEYREGLDGSVQVTMDKLAKRFVGDIVLILAILVITVAAYIRLGQNPSVLLVGSLAITFFVAADIILSH